MWRAAPAPLMTSARRCSTEASVSIGSVTAPLHRPSVPALVPSMYLRGPTSSDGGAAAATASDATLLKHLRWMLQKDCLGQDMFLLGAPGMASVLRALPRRLFLVILAHSPFGSPAYRLSSYIGLHHSSQGPQRRRLALAFCELTNRDVE